MRKYPNSGWVKMFARGRVRWCLTENIYIFVNTHPVMNKPAPLDSEIEWHTYRRKAPGTGLASIPLIPLVPHTRPDTAIPEN